MISITRSFSLGLAFLVLLGAAASPAPGQSFLTNGLIAYYPFNGNAADMAGTNPGVSFGATLTADRFGNPNSAYFFNGSDAYIQTVHPLPDLTTATFSVWFNPNQIFSSTRALLSDSDYVIGNDWLMAVVNTGSAYGLNVTSTKSGTIFSATITNGVGSFTQPLTNNWLHFVWVMQPASQQIYVNGTVAASVSSPANDVGNHNLGFVIGAFDAYSPYREFFGGAIDDIRIYKRALSSSEVARLYALESVSYLNLHKAVYVDSSNLQVGTNYQLQVSSDLNTWTNCGTAFIATNSTWRATNYWDVENWNALFFRLQVSP
jgi:hypothetical protein